MENRNNSHRSIIEINNEFIGFEDRAGLMDLLIHGYRIWPDIRLLIYLRVLRETGGLDAFSYLAPTKKLQWIVKAIPGFVGRNPFLGPKKCDFLFWSNARRARQPDGFYWDIYTDPVIDALTERYRVRVIENTFKGRHSRPPKTPKLLHADIITVLAYLRRKRVKVDLQPEEINRLQEIDSDIRRMFDVDVDLADTVLKHLKNRAAYVPLYTKLLKRYRPKAVFLVCSYGKEMLIEACKLENIPVVEIQHGIIGPGHMGYCFSAVGDKPNFPDYLFSFGDYWKKNVRFPIEDDHVISFGFPFLTMNAAGVNCKKSNTILFISQGTIGKALSEFALEIHDRVPAEYRIVYKLHPAETHGWKQKYAELAESDITVVDTDTPSLYSLLSESKLLFGVYSTAIYEGLYFGCKVYVVKLPGYEHSLGLVESGAATLIEESGSFSFDDAGSGYDRNAFFDRDWKTNLQKGIDLIIQ